ncbi:unnamed protein product [Ectocarpus sp. CCAP 1310/34]|nr:unnamed protein product [Ectocarpus sp. CCAP 1310/34]
MNLAFYSAPVVFSCDAFNAWGLGNKRSQAVQRLKNQTHVGTLATPGARSEGENGLQCEILGLLQQGCLGRRVLRDEQGARSEEEVFVRGGLLLMCGDGPGRSKCLGTKAPNNFSKFPCSYCMVSHGDDETGGDVGNPQFDIDKHRRTWGRTMDGFSELEALADDPLQQEERSKELGLVAPNASGLKLPLYHAMRIVPGDHVPVERLHFDALLCQVFCLELLSKKGRRLVSAIMAQKSSLLYPPGTDKLKDILTDYPSLTGSDKWTLQSIMLLVFRVVLQDIPSMRRNMKKRDMKAFKAEWGTYESVLDALRTLIQMVSLLSFALRAPSYNDKELRQLDNLARDVGAFSQMMGRTGSRPTIHSMLHAVEAIRLHGVCPDASTGEHAHQMNKSGKAVDCGRMPSLHMAKSANVNSALVALSNGLPYRINKYNRSSNAHELVSVKPGAGCVQLMQSLASFLGHARVPTDIHAKAIQTPAQLRGQFQGSAVWTASLFNAGAGAPALNEQQDGGEWLSRLESSKFRPDNAALLGGYKKFFACDMAGACSNICCPNCWVADDLETVTIECSRYLRVPMAASCGVGRLKGGDVKSAAQPGPRDDWALGSGGGDNVEVHQQPSTMGEAGRVDPRDLSLVKVLYFFRHQGNPPLMGGAPPPLTWWVLGYDYTGVRHGNDRAPDSVTGHPTLQLRGRGRPVVYPADAIHRQVHLYHACPLRGEHGADDRSHVCKEEVVVGGSSGRRRVWRHYFREATPGTDGYDRYLVNECHHSINQDTVI